MPFIELVAQRRAPTPPMGMQPPENAKDWFRIENSAEDADETDVYVYDSIGGFLGMWADEFIHQLGQVTTSKINLRLNSPGGSVFEGIAIANAIRSHPATVTVYVDSMAASIASVIALAGDRVVMMPHAQFMVHNASGVAYGDATEMTKMADLLDKQSLNIAKAYAEHTGRPLAEWQDYMAAETWFTAEEAVAVGLADEAMPMKPKKEAPVEEPAAFATAMNRTWDLSMYRYAGRENSPDPVKKDTVIKVELAGTVIDEVILDSARKTVRPGGLITAEATAELAPDELIVSEGTISAMSRDDLLDLIREAVRAEMTPAEQTEDADKKLPAFLQPDEDEDEDEDADGESGSESNDAKVVPPEAFVGEKTDTIPAGETNSPKEHPLDTGLGDSESTVERTETYDENDEWLSLVDRLVPVASPSADDVFTSLKEAW